MSSSSFGEDPVIRMISAARSAAAGSGLRRPTSLRCASISCSTRITESTAAISPRLSCSRQETPPYVTWETC